VILVQVVDTAALFSLSPQSRRLILLTVTYLKMTVLVRM